MNPYSEHINSLFIRLLELRHIVSNIKTVLRGSINSYKKVEYIDAVNRSALVINDWTGMLVNGYPILHHTGIRKTTLIANYEQEIEKIISQECCYAYAQSFEALETFFKNCLIRKIKYDTSYSQKINILDPGNYERSNVPSGDKLFELIKKACGPNFAIYSAHNNLNIPFKELWTVLSESRHAITHSNSILNKTRLKTDIHISIINTLFQFNEIDINRYKLVLDYVQFVDLINNVAEFGFQIFKMISEEERLDWNILK